MKANTQEEVIKTLNPLLRGFANYYRGVVSKATFSYVENRVWRYLWRWATRRHPNKSKRWIFSHYFSRYKGRIGTFMCKGKGRGRDEQLYVLCDVSKIPIVRHVKVKGTASPDDSTLREYWYNRNVKEGRNKWAKGSSNEQIAKFQNWKCPICGDYLFNGEEIETHHIKPVAEGGLDDPRNRIHLHKTCHAQEHRKPSLKA